MWPILACSVLASGIIVERCWSLRLNVIAPPKLASLNVTELSDWNRAANPQLAAALNSVLGFLLIRLRDLETENREETYDLFLLSAAHEMEKYLTLLGVIGLIAPLLGILGTIFGMIEVFDALTFRAADPTILSSGISTALITTAFGLIVAIPALVAHRLFYRRVDSLLIYLDTTSRKILDPQHKALELFHEPSR